TPNELRWALAAELGLKFSANIDASQLLQLLQRQLILLAQNGKKIILVIDEAQALPDNTLESLRLLTNLETEQRKLLQVVLFGQPELDLRLASQQFRQFRQRISFAYQLPVMSAAQIRHYVRHRLQIAGATPALFNRFALLALTRYSRGIPRLVNLLAHKGLMLAYGEGKSRVTGRHIRFAAQDTDDTRLAHSYYLWFLTAAAVFSAACFAWVWQ
ncbi:ExeA family protein, partial [Arsukibacterium sp.]|uniref:ExeA family protein n=1 Tax=Arsukibacterium sp. TaxID=1977258 RepID=UPI00299D2730